MSSDNSGPTPKGASSTDGHDETMFEPLEHDEVTPVASAPVDHHAGPEADYPDGVTFEVKPLHFEE